MKVLFIHQNFPGQFRHLAKRLAGQQGCDVRAIGRDYAPGLPDVPMRLHRYRLHRDAATQTHPYAHGFEKAVLHGQAVLRVLLRWRARGYRPDIVIAHPGWGETLYVKQVWPDVPLIHYCEYYYHAQGTDAGFDPEFPLTEHRAASIESRNALHLLNLEHCDLGITPTRWQCSLHPEAYRYKLRVIHEGVDLANLGPDPHASLSLPDGHVLHAGEPVVTYVARNLEPYRGFHQFMRALPDVLARNPNGQAVIVGGDDVSYGSKPKNAPNWRTKLLRENPVDASRVHFLGRVDYTTYGKVLQISRVHAYLTYPFVLSWSLLEAMACGCAVVASDTAPVREVLSNGENAILVDFLQPDALAAAIGGQLADDAFAGQLRVGAIRSASRYFSAAGIEHWMETITGLLASRGDVRHAATDTTQAHPVTALHGSSMLRPDIAVEDEA